MTDTIATAAASGANATDRFLSDVQVGAGTTPERVSLLARAVIEGVHDTIRKHDVTYEEYNALKAWMISVGEDGEWPLFLDVWIEHAVEDVFSRDRAGSKGSIEGPYYVSDAPAGTGEVTLGQRDGEPGTPLRFHGVVQSVDGTPLPNATVEMWHADAEGYYSQFAPGIPEWNLRGQVQTDAEGQFVINTIQPAPYQIPTDGACGKLIAAASWHAWRPAHLHLKVAAEGHQLITTQLYFPGDEHNDDDIATAVKPELLLDPKPAERGVDVTYDFTLDGA